jgi:hypothetical protein
MEFETNKNIIIFSIPLASILAILFVNLSLLSAYGEDLAQVEIEIKNSNGDRTGASNIVFKIYQSATDILYTELKPKSEYPYFVASLPIGHTYKLDGFVNGIFAGSSIINIQNTHEQIDFFLPKSSGMNFQIFYDDAYTPIVGAEVTLKNNGGKTLRKDYSDREGKTLTFGASPTIKEEDFYQIEIFIGENINYTYSPIKLPPDTSRDIKITTPWPKIIDYLTVHAYNNDLSQITSDDGSYVVELYDEKNNRIANSNLNYLGEAYFSNLQIGYYHLLVNNIEKNNTTVILNQTLSILDKTNEF